MYYTAIEGQLYEATKAKTLASAKRAAERKSIWQGATLSVAVRAYNAGNDCFQRISVKRNDQWQDLV